MFRSWFVRKTSDCCSPHPHEAILPWPDGPSLELRLLCGELQACAEAKSSFFITFPVSVMAQKKNFRIDELFKNCSLIILTGGSSVSEEGIKEELLFLFFVRILILSRSPCAGHYINGTSLITMYALIYELGVFCTQENSDSYHWARSVFEDIIGTFISHLRIKKKSPRVDAETSTLCRKAASKASVYMRHLFGSHTHCPRVFDRRVYVNL